MVAENGVPPAVVPLTPVATERVLPGTRTNEPLPVKSAISAAYTVALVSPTGDAAGRKLAVNEVRRPLDGSVNASDAIVGVSATGDENALPIAVLPIPTYIALAVAPVAVVVSPPTVEPPLTSTVIGSVRTGTGGSGGMGGNGGIGGKGGKGQKGGSGGGQGR